MISSKSNPKIKWFRRLQADRQFRHREQTFVAEGFRWLKEVEHLNIRPLVILATDQWLEETTNREISQNLSEKIWIVNDQVMAHASTMETPPGVLTALSIPTNLLPEKISLLLILDGISNPGNLGTIMRTAFAAGVEGVLLAPGCVDAFNPKAIRGGMGAQLRLPILRTDWTEISNLSRNVRVWLASSLGTIGHTEVNWKLPSALIIGSEARGHGDSARALSSNQLYIPMAPGVESLNAAVATGIILFEAARQRSIS